MSDFQNRPLVRDVDDARGLNVASQRALKISVTDARELSGTISSGGNTLMIFSGLIRFGQDDQDIDPQAADGRNENSPNYSELDGEENHSPRTVMLRLRGPTLADEQFKGSSAVAALADVFLSTTDAFGVGTDNGSVLLTQPVEDGNPLPRDLWFMSDVRAENNSDGTSQINRMLYQATVVLTLK